ncbi:MAG TPA: extracellular solute-binding protein [Terriglobia bacterium]|nr:extracellular solute-binding protein [Terriglobia bacterium]
MKRLATALVLVAALSLAIHYALGHRSGARGITLTVWSMEADEPAKVAFRELAAQDLERAHPGVHVKFTWYDMDGLTTSLHTALPAGQGPDVFYLEPDQTDYITYGFIAPLDGLVNWSNIYCWARQAWMLGGKTWAAPQEVYTNELYYNKELMRKLGASLPPRGQFSQAQFLDLVRKARAAGITPIAQGVGDRDFPGAYIVTQALLHKLGLHDYGELFHGKLSFQDPRVLEVFQWVKDLIDAGAYPKDFMTLRLSESMYYFYQRPGALMLPMGSWYVGWAFVSAADGGEPKDFPLGIMQFPAMDGGACNECKTRSVGASFAIDAESRHKKLAAEFLNDMSTPAMGQRWIETVHLQTAVKARLPSAAGAYGGYFKQLMERQQGEKYFFGDPTDFLHGRCLDAFTQIMNTAFPAGLVPVDRATKMMNRACYQNFGREKRGSK